MENRALRMIFSLFVGVLFALLVGFSIQAFYPQPEASTSIASASDYAAYALRLEAYNRVVSLVAVGIGILPILVSHLLPIRAAVIADGVLFGGLFTLLYGAGRGAASGQTAASFVAVTLGLLAVLVSAHVHTVGWLWPRLRHPDGSRRAVPDQAMLTVLVPLTAGVLATLAVELGIRAFYPPPPEPYAAPAQSITAFLDASAVYARNAGAIAIVAGAVVLASSFVLVRRSRITSDSLFLGGLFTMVFGDVRSVGQGHFVLSFFMAVVGLVLAIAAGHMRFVGLPLKRNAARPTDDSSRRAADRMLAILFPLSVGVQSVVAFELGVNAYYPAPEFGADANWYRTVSVVATGVAVLLWVASIALGKVSPITANALLLGGLLTLAFGVAPAAVAGEETVVVVALAVALVVVLFTGYRQFASRRHHGPPPSPTA